MIRFLCKEKLHNNVIRFFATKVQDFEAAYQNYKKIAKQLDQSTQLELYGLYKQTLFGKISNDAIRSSDSTDIAKFDAWKKNENLSKEEARSKYIDLVNSLLNSTENTSKVFDSTSKDINFSQSNKIFKITLNKPKKYNALNYDMYTEITKALEYANQNKDIALTVITGTGDYFCSGNDLSNFNLDSLNNMKEIANKAEKIFLHFVHAFIIHQKPLIMLVNGPAIGVAVTILGLADYVIASDKATFSTPFTSLGQSPEGCSSYTFPLLMGTSKANEMLIFGKKLTAEEAYKQNLVGKVIPHNNFLEETEKIITKYAQLPVESLSLNKQLIRQVHKNNLIDINIKETAFLKSRWLSKEFQIAITNFLKRKT